MKTTYEKWREVMRKMNARRQEARGLIDGLTDAGVVCLPASGGRLLGCAGAVPEDRARTQELLERLDNDEFLYLAVWREMLLKIPGTDEVLRRYDTTDLFGSEEHLEPGEVCEHMRVWYGSEAFVFCPLCQHEPNPDDPVYWIQAQGRGLLSEKYRQGRGPVVSRTRPDGA